MFAGVSWPAWWNVNSSTSSRRLLFIVILFNRHTYTHTINAWAAIHRKIPSSHHFIPSIIHLHAVIVINWPSKHQHHYIVLLHPDIIIFAQYHSVMNNEHSVLCVWPPSGSRHLNELIARRWWKALTLTTQITWSTHHWPIANCFVVTLCVKCVCVCH